MQVYIDTAGCTAFLLTQPGKRNTYSEQGMVDGVIEMTDRLVGPRAIREIEVGKFRGSSYLRGRHTFEITSNGIEVHPRTEALLSHPPADDQMSETPKRFGISRLDEMLEGGVCCYSSTVLLGTPGSGKTVLGLHFLHQGALEGENGLYFGFYETPARLMAKASQLSLPLNRYIEEGLLDIVWQAHLENLPDARAEILFDIVREKKIKRLFLDGIEPFSDWMIYPERNGPFFTAVMNELRALGVTALVSSELPELFSARIALPLERVSAAVDNIIFLRYVELRSQLYRLISILKARESGYDPSIREFKISGHGIDVADTFESAEAILTGVARPLPGVTGRANPKRQSGKGTGGV